MLIKKKGQTLVEVMVALSILIVILSGVITLLIKSVNLVIDSRSKTEAIAIVQNGLSEGISSVQGTCQIHGDDNGSPKMIIDRTSTTTGTPNYLVENPESHNKYKLIVTLQRFNTDANNIDVSLQPSLTDAANFGVVVSQVLYNNKGDTTYSSTYTLSQLVRLR
ncbi:MAG: type II secretion system protein [Patescibacteria group bacterium]|jgi:type II secretory pathway pseudopilin PulG|nr:type II secretion system protein [Patescibacteria group bacterium]